MKSLEDAKLAAYFCSTHTCIKQFHIQATCVSSVSAVKLGEQRF